MKDRIKFQKVVKSLGNPIDFYRKLSGRFNYYCCSAAAKTRLLDVFPILLVCCSFHWKSSGEEHCNTYKNGSYNFTFASSKRRGRRSLASNMTFWLDSFLHTAKVDCLLTALWVPLYSEKSTTVVSRGLTVGGSKYTKKL